MLREQLLKDPRVRLPVRSWRAPGVKGIRAIAPKFDPAFDVAGLPDPFSVYFPIFITNLYTATIYITSLLISPPAGWTDSEQNLTTCGVGVNVRTEKSNATRAVMATPHNEAITVRFNYRTGSYAGTIIGFDDFQITIYWENITGGTIDATDDFETDYDGWTLTSLVGTLAWTRQTLRVVHGAYAVRVSADSGEEGYMTKAQVIGAGTRAYLFGFFLHTGAGSSRITVSGPVEDLDVVYMAAAVWRRFGIRLNPGASNTVRIYVRAYWAASIMDIDYLRWVRF